MTTLLPSALPGVRVRLLVVVAVLAAVAGFATATSRAEARLSWCFGDPVVEIAGEQVDINILVPAENLESLQNPVEIVVHIPAGVPHGLVEVNSPYFEENLTFVEEPGWAWQPGSRFRVEVGTLVHATEQIRVRVEITFDRAGAERTVARSGHANRWVEAAFRLGQ